jgi:ephrin-B
MAIGAGQAKDYCTSGFISLDRMHAVLGNYNGKDVEEFGGSAQAIIPGINFTCSGSIESWTFGARWEQDTDFIELQIWRPGSEDGSYTKVGSTTINVEEEGQTDLYQYPLSSPLHFQAGDILGYYQPARTNSRWLLRFEREGRGRQLRYYDIRTSAARQLNATGPGDNRFQLFVNVVTDSPDCVCGFMSVERMRLLLGLDSVGGRINTQSRQQITPDIRFTCDGMITKWIVGADWANHKNLYPELQVWRSSGNGTYRKINGTLIDVDSSTESKQRVYEYNNFPPIPFQAGDILGVFMPQSRDSKLKLRAEEGHGHTNYYIPTADSDTVSPYDSIDLQQLQDTPQVSSSVYHPLVTVEIVVKTPQTSSVTHLQTTTAISQTPPGKSHSSVGAGVGGAVGAAVVLLIAMSVLGAGLLIVWRRRNTSKLVQQPVPVNATAAHFDSPVYGGNAVPGNDNGIHCYKSTQQQEDNSIILYESHSADYESVTSPSNPWPVALHNPLYSDTGHVTDEGEALVSTTEHPYVLTTIQRKRGMEKGDQEDVYSTPYTTDGQQEFFEETDIYWAPASTVTGIYEQLSHHKYREISRLHIEVGESLGSGQFGMVSRGKWLAAVGGPVDVAIKTLQPSAKETDRVKFLQEAAINGQFRHPNIVQLHGVVTVGDPVMIVLEYTPNGDLRNFLHSMKAQHSPSQQGELSQQCLSFSQHVAAGMSYLAGKAFVHRDLAARNILVSETRVCKVADFGMARDLDEGSYYISHGGQIPVKWTAPEALHYKKSSAASDVWSFGCLMYEIWSLGHKPFEGFANPETIVMIDEGKRLAPPPGCPLEMYCLMITCWNSDKSGRPQFREIVQTLSQSEDELLFIPEEVTRGHPQASILGAPLEAGRDLYPQLQNTYIH